MNALNNEPKTDLDYVVEKNIKVQMRDGVKLALDLYKPLNNGRLKKGRYPTLLVRTPYNKDNYQKDGVWFCTKGYAVCIQDIRGRFQSEGSFVKYGFSDVDGYDTIEWAAKQNWSTGKVGTFGGSFLAHVQVAAATQKPPHLRAMVLSQGGYANAYLSGIRHGGAFEMTSLCWLLTRSLNSNEASQNPILKKALEMIPLEGYLDPRRGQVKQGITPFNFFSDYEKIFFDTLLHSEYDEYWKTPWHSAELFYDNFADVPVLIETGWYDHYTLNDCMLYTGLSRGKRGPIKLIIGPWTHGGTMLTYSGEVEFGPTAPLDAGIAQSHNDLILGWFDHWLKAIDNGVENDPTVRIFVMGGGPGARRYRFMQHGGKWRNEKDWPLPDTNYTPYYFHEDSSLALEPPTKRKSHTSYTFDPRDPVPTIGGNRHTHYMLGGDDRSKSEGAFDQVERPDFFGCKYPYVPLAFRNDVLVFKTSPLSDSIEVTGPIKVVLWASSSSVDTDFTAKLIDWYPPNIGYPLGFAMNLTDGIMRARFHKSWEKPELLKPNQIYQFEITLYPTSNLFAKNHQIRVDVSSSNWPRFDINPNTCDPLGRSRRFVITENTIYHNNIYASHIVLPVIRRKKK